MENNEHYEGALQTRRLVNFIRSQVLIRMMKNLASSELNNIIGTQTIDIELTAF